MANLHQKLYDLKHQRAGFLKNAQDALDVYKRQPDWLVTTMEVCEIAGSRPVLSAVLSPFILSLIHI